MLARCLGISVLGAVGLVSACSTSNPPGDDLTCDEGAVVGSCTIGSLCAEYGTDWSAAAAQSDCEASGAVTFAAGQLCSSATPVAFDCLFSGSGKTVRVWYLGASAASAEATCVSTGGTWCPTVSAAGDASVEAGSDAVTSVDASSDAQDEATVAAGGGDSAAVGAATSNAADATPAQSPANAASASTLDATASGVDATRPGEGGDSASAGPDASPQDVVTDTLLDTQGEAEASADDPYDGTVDASAGAEDEGDGPPDSVNSTGPLPDVVDAATPADVSLDGVEATEP